MNHGNENPESETEVYRECNIPESGYSFRYPEKMSISVEMNYPAARLLDENRTGISFSTQQIEKDLMESLMKEGGLQDFIEKGKQIFQNSYPGLIYIKDNKITLNDKTHPVYFIEYEEEGQPFKQIMVLYLDLVEEKMHNITLTVPKERFDDIEPVFHKIVTSFKTT